MKNNVSIIIITKNREKLLKRTIKSLKNQDYDGKYEIIVVDSSGKTTPLEGVKYIYDKNANIPTARNIGIKNSKYDLVSFIDDDCIASRNWLNELVKSIDKNAGVGSAVFPTKTNKIGKAVSFIGFPGGGLSRYHNSKGKLLKIKRISTCGCLFKKNIIQKVGFFNENYVYGDEDSELSDRIISHGHNLIYSPKSIVYHKPREDLKSIFKWFFRRGIAIVYLKNRKDKFKQLFLPFRSALLSRILILVFLVYFLRLYGLLVFSIFLVLYFIRKMFKHKGYVKELGVLFLIPIIELTMETAKGIGKICGIFK